MENFTPPYRCHPFGSSCTWREPNIFYALFIVFQRFHDGSDVQEILNVEHPQGHDISPNMSRDSQIRYITFYEDEKSLPGKKTAVWEFDKGYYMCSLFWPCFNISFYKN